MGARDGVFWKGGREKDGVSWKKRVRKDGRTRRETARPQGLFLSFYGHEKRRRRRREAASGSAVGSRGQKCLGKLKEEGTKKMMSATRISDVNRGAM